MLFPHCHTSCPTKNRGSSARYSQFRNLAPRASIDQTTGKPCHMPAARGTSDQVTAVYAVSPCLGGWSFLR